MGFIIDGKVIDLTQNNETAKKINNGLNQIRENYKLKKDSGYVRFVYPDSRITPDFDYPDKVKHKPKGIDIDYREIVVDESGIQHEWIYFESYNRDKDGMLKTYPQDFHFNGSVIMGLKDLEKIYWMINICSRTENGANSDVKKLQYIKVDDEEKRAEEAIKNERNKLKVRAKILNDKDEGGMAEDELREVASAFFVSNAHNADINVVKDRLLKTLDVKANGYTKFEDMVNMEDGTKDISALVQKGIDNKVWDVKTVTTNEMDEFKQKKKKSSWRYKKKQGAVYVFSDEICPSIGEDHKANLVDYFKKHPKAREHAESVLNMRLEDNVKK